mmetsp:Transcript_30769/g.81940  ORF Transcript_30769/g.81940 Transcript_30769/m.81940 type:complete len:708 (-) Transcript_30769:45-2168(-)
MGTRLLGPRRWVADYRAAGASAAAADVATGLGVGLVFWPLALGNAAIARVPPSVAVGTAVLPAVVYAVLGSLPLLALQSGSTVALCLGELTAQADALGMTPMEVASLTSLFVGLFHLVLGALDLAFVAELFSQPLLRGRTVIAAVMVLSGSFRTLLGIKLDGPSSIPLIEMGATAKALPTADRATSLMSTALIALLLGLRFVGRCAARARADTSGESPTSHDGGGITPTLYGQESSNGCTTVDAGAPARRVALRRRCRSRCCTLLLLAARALAAAASVIVLVAGPLFSRMAGDPHLRLIARVDVPSFRPHLEVPGLERIRTLVPAAALIAFLSLGSHLTVADRIRRPGDYVNHRQELVALGTGSIVSALVGGMPVMPNLAVCQSLRHCTSGLASLGNAAGHLIAFYIAATCPPVQQVPACAIATIITMEFLPLLLEVPKDVRHLFKQMKLSSDGHWTWRTLLSSDLAIYVAAIVSPLLLGIIWGSFAAIGLELLFAMSRFAGPGYTHLGRVAGTFDTYDELGVLGSAAEELEGLNIVRFSGPRWFGNCVSTTRVAREKRRAAGKVCACIVVDMSMVSFLDETALHHYKREWSQHLGYRIVVTSCCARVRRQLEQAGIPGLLGQPPDTFINLHNAVRFAEAHVAEARSPVASSPGAASPGEEREEEMQIRARRPSKTSAVAGRNDECDGLSPLSLLPPPVLPPPSVVE